MSNLEEQEPKEYVLVLSISPFYDFNEALIRKLCVALLSRSTRIAVVALRALEALIIKNRNKTHIAFHQPPLIQNRFFGKTTATKNTKSV